MGIACIPILNTQIPNLVEYNTQERSYSVIKCANAPPYFLICSSDNIINLKKNISSD